MPNEIRYPEVTVPMAGADGNAYAIIARVRRALRRAGVPGHEVAAFIEAAEQSGSYDGLLATVMSWVDVE